MGGGGFGGYGMWCSASHGGLSAPLRWLRAPACGVSGLCRRPFGGRGPSWYPARDAGGAELRELAVIYYLYLYFVLFILQFVVIPVIQCMVSSW